MTAVRKMWILVAGWMLVVVGIAALVLPGPGLLLLFAGLAVLSQEYEWANRRVEPVKQKAMRAAEEGVQNWLRITLSGAGALTVMAVGVVWGLDPRIPTIGPFGPSLPFAGWGVGSSLILSGIIALVLLAYSVRRFRPGPPQR